MNNINSLRVYTFNRRKDIRNAYQSLKEEKIDKLFFIRYITDIRDETSEVIRFMRYYIECDEDECELLNNQINDTYWLYLNKVI